MRAVILCAGTGTRFKPLSLVCPKPLTPVRGRPLVEHTILLLRENGIADITLVVGYMREKFAWLERYGVNFVYNERYEETNNNTSVALVRHLLDDCLIVDGDLYFYSDPFASLPRDRSLIITQPTVAGLEWRLETDDEGRILRVDKWRPDGFGMVGVSYWRGEAAALLGEELSRSAPDEYWEDAALRVFSRAPVYARRHAGQFVREMDTIKDAMDSGLLTHEEVAAIYSRRDFNKVKLKGLTNNTWLVSPAEGVFEALRVPGKGTEKFIRRGDEPVIVGLIRDLRITPHSKFYPGGFKTSAYLGEHRISSFRDFHPDYFKELALLLHKMHKVPYHESAGINPSFIANEIELYEHTASRAGDAATREWLKRKARDFDARPQVLCHRDLLLENILVRDGEKEAMRLVDFEYAGFTCYLWDLASFILEAGLEGETRMLFVDSYGLDEQEKSELTHMEILVDYIWGLWGFTNNYTEYGENRLNRMSAKLALL